MEVSYKGITIAPTYSYYMTGRTDREKGYVIRIDNPANINNPGIVFLASGIEEADEAYFVINKSRYNIPPLSGSLEEKIQGDSKSQGKAQFYTVTTGDDIVGKFIVPLDPENLLVRESPLVPKQPTATPKPLVCTPELDENKCIRAGGDYRKINDKLSLCFCPD